MATMAEELNLKFYLINLNLNSHMWLLATILDYAATLTTMKT